MSPITEDQVREELKKVIDPELFVNIVDLGLIYVVEIKPAAPKSLASEAADTSQGSTSDPQITTDEPLASGSDTNVVDESASESSAGDLPAVDVVIEMTMTSPACPAGPQLIANSRAVVARMPSVSDVEVRIVMEPPWTPDRMTEDARDQLGIF